MQFSGQFAIHVRIVRVQLSTITKYTFKLYITMFHIISKEGVCAFVCVYVGWWRTQKLHYHDNNPAITQSLRNFRTVLTDFGMAPGLSYYSSSGGGGGVLLLSGRYLRVSCVLDRLPTGWLAPRICRIQGGVGLNDDLTQDDDLNVPLRILFIRS